MKKLFSSSYNKNNNGPVFTEGKDRLETEETKEAQAKYQ